MYARFFGEGPVNTCTGATPLVTVANTGTAIITVVADAVFAVLTFNYPAATAVDISAVTFKAGMEIVGVRSYQLTSGTIIAYHSK